MASVRMPFCFKAALAAHIYQAKCIVAGALSIGTHVVAQVVPSSSRHSKKQQAPDSHREQETFVLPGGTSTATD